MHKIPTISYNDLKNTNKEVLEFLTLSLENNGFFVINNHPIDLKLISNAFQIAEEMFSLSFETKQKYHVPGTNGARGYTPYGIETALNEKVADQKEFWHQGSTTNAELMSNIYVDEIDNFKDFFVNVYCCPIEKVRENSYDKPNIIIFSFNNFEILSCNIP